MEEKKPDFKVNVNLDTTPILYTENIIMTTSEDGVVLDFAQKVGSTNDLRVVARIGMSRSHANKFINELGKLLIRTEGQIQTSGKVVN